LPMLEKLVQRSGRQKPCQELHEELYQWFSFLYVLWFIGPALSVPRFETLFYVLGMTIAIHFAACKLFTKPANVYRLPGSVHLHMNCHYDNNPLTKPIRAV
jgi:hypothetical protein